MEFLSTPWGFASIAFVATAVVAIVYRVGFMSFSKGNILVGRGEQKKVSPHSTCPYAKDIMELIHRTTEHMERRQELKTFLIEEQMKYYEETEEEVLGLMRKTYLSLLADKLQGDASYAQHPEYTAYIVTLKAIASEVKSYMRGCFKANHYAERSIEEQRVYVEKKKTVVVQKITELLNIYWRGVVVTRSELYKEHTTLLPELQEYVETIFNEAFLLARNSSTKIQQLEEAYNTYLIAVLGADKVGGCYGDC